MKRRYCHLCGRPVTRYHSYQRQSPGEAQPTLIVCSDCEATKPRCVLCGVPMTQGHNGDTRPNTDRVCGACRRTRPFCLACGQPIAGSFLEIGGQAPFCLTCYQTRPHCDVCGVPVGEPHWILADGRRTCNQCHQTAVYSPQQAQQVFDWTCGVIRDRLGLSLNVPTGFAVVDRNQLREVMSEAPDAPGLDPHKTLGFFVRRGKQRSMYVESGLPQSLLIQVIAHEFAHAWQGENCPLLSDPLVREGFAEWVAYKVLQAMEATEKMALMQKRQDVYGQGLRHVMEIEATRGVSGVLDYCQAAPETH